MLLAKYISEQLSYLHPPATGRCPHGCPITPLPCSFARLQVSACTLHCTAHRAAILEGKQGIFNREDMHVPALWQSKGITSQRVRQRKEAYEGYKIYKPGLQEPPIHICLPEECPSVEIFFISLDTPDPTTASRAMSTQETTLSAFSSERYTFDPTNDPDGEFARLCIAR